MCVKATPIYTKSDGMIERLQQAMFVKDLKDDWDQHLPLLTIAFNSSLQESTKCTPNILMLRMKLHFLSSYHRAHPIVSPVKCAKYTLKG